MPSLTLMTQASPRNRIRWLTYFTEIEAGYPDSCRKGRAEGVNRGFLGDGRFEIEEGDPLPIPTTVHILFPDML